MTDPTTIALLSQLERRIQAVERRPAAGAETLSATYLTANPDNTIGANFTGKITAQGIVLTPGTSAVSAIQWQRTVDGAVIAQVTGYSDSSTGYQHLAAGAAEVGLGNPAYAALSAAAPAPTVRNANVSAQTLDPTYGTSVTATARQGPPNYTVVVIDYTGASSFLQLTAAASRKANFGSSTITWDGINRTSATQTVAHGLGVTPVAVFAMTVTTGAATSTFVYEDQAADATNIYIKGYAPAATPPAINQTFYWLAIG